MVLVLCVFLCDVTEGYSKLCTWTQNKTKNICMYSTILCVCVQPTHDNFQQLIQLLQIIFTHVHDSCWIDPLIDKCGHVACHA